MFVRNPDCLALESVDSTDSACVRTSPAHPPATVVNPLTHDACDDAHVECSFAPSARTAAGKAYALAAALQAWTRRATARRPRIRAYHRKRPHEPTITSQTALDFATELNARFNRAEKLTGYPAASLHATPGVLCCAVHRKAVYAALLALAIGGNVAWHEGTLSAIALDLTAPRHYAAIVPVDDPRLVAMIKLGLRNATALFARTSTHAAGHSVATMTAGIRN